MNGTPPQVSPTFIEASDGDNAEEQQQQHHHEEQSQQQQQQQQQPEKSSSSSTLFRGSKQGIRKLQKCLSTSVSHYDGEHHQSASSSNFPFHSQRSVDVRGYVATASSSSTAAAATAASSLQAASSSSLTSPFILTNTRQYSSFGSTNSKFN